MARTTDHRGRRCSIRDPAWVIVRLPDGEAARRFAARLNARVRFRADLLVVFAGLVLGIVASTALTMLSSSPEPWWIRVGLGVLMVFLGGALGALLAGPLSAHETRHVVRVYLSERICPSCAYPLAGVRLEPDGCTVCPECGTAWRLPQ